jgi:hypothetical protein
VTSVACLIRRDCRGRLPVANARRRYTAHRIVVRAPISFRASSRRGDPYEVNFGGPENRHPAREWM